MTSSVDMVILNDLGLNVWQPLEMSFTSILLKYLDFYSSVWLQSGDKKQTVANLLVVECLPFFVNRVCILILL